MKPTNQLRFVERDETSVFSYDGTILPADVVRTIKIKVLQQLWTSDYEGEPDEWRDVEGQEIV